MTHECQLQGDDYCSYRINVRLTFNYILQSYSMLSNSAMWWEGQVIRL